MTFHVITLFPEIFPPYLNSSIIGRSQKQKLVKFNFINPRDFVKDKYKSVDDKPYGGGPGMIMKAEPIVQALESIPVKPFTILLSANGKLYNQKIAQKLKTKKTIALICGHYEGVDARIEKFIDETISIGDFVLTGGEIAALTIIDSVTRLLPRVINQKSLLYESFSPNINYLLEPPQYTRPENFRNQKVPKVLLEGNHIAIEKWRESESVKRTKKFRKNLLLSTKH